MANILFISSYPLPLDKGSNQHAYFYMKALAEHHNVHCLFFRQAAQSSSLSDHDAAFKEIGLGDIRQITFSSPIIKNQILKRITGLLSFPYNYAKQFNTTANRELLKKFVLEKEIDVVHVESLHYALLMWGLPPTVKKAFVYHDLHHKIFFEQAKYIDKRYNRIDPVFAGIKVYFFEQMINRTSDLKIFLNSDEMTFTPDRSVHVPHIVNPDIRYQKARKNLDKINIFFLGGFNHPPNRVAMDLIAAQVLPELLQSSGSPWKFQIIGKGTEKFGPLIKRHGLDERTRIRGFVGDINDVFEEMDIALFPIPYGGGIKTKVIETMAAGIPVITTDNGVFGLHGLSPDCINVCNTPQEIVTALAGLMADPKLRESQSKAARSYVQKNHSYESMRDKLIAAYQGII